MAAFKNWNNLESLSIMDNQEELQVAILNGLKYNKNLKQLRFVGYSLLFNTNFSTGISFRLKELVISGLLDEARNFHNINLFLITQREKLEILTIGHFINSEILKTILSMPRLKKLYLAVGIHNSQAGFSVENFLPSQSVTSLSVPYFDGQKDFFKLILKVFPNIEFLELDSLHDEDANVISDHCQHLKHLSVWTFKGENFSNEAFYLSLRKFERTNVWSYEANVDALSKKLNVQKKLIYYTNFRDKNYWIKEIDAFETRRSNATN